MTQPFFFLQAGDNRLNEKDSARQIKGHYLSVYSL